MDDAQAACRFLRKSLKSSSIWSHGSLSLSFSSLPCRGIPLGTCVQKSERQAPKRSLFPCCIAFSKTYLCQEHRFLSAGGKQGKEDTNAGCVAKTHGGKRRA